MMTSFSARLLAGLVLPLIFVPAAFAQYYDQHPATYHHVIIDNNNDNRNINRSTRNRHRAYQRQRAKAIAKDQRRYNRTNQRLAYSDNWNWNQHDWNDQRAHLRNNWRQNHDRLSLAQQQQLDAQMKAQWRQYNNNNWNGQYTWDQYSDPRFLDYIHTRNPSLVNTIRSYFGY
jgi:hypothetical protein